MSTNKFFNHTLSRNLNSLNTIFRACIYKLEKELMSCILSSWYLKCHLILYTSKTIIVYKSHVKETTCREKFNIYESSMLTRINLNFLGLKEITNKKLIILKYIYFSNSTSTLTINQNLIH